MARPAVVSEALLSSPKKGVSLGVTVDPVKIDSLEAFGTPEEVASRVLAVEEGRDGVLDVQLRSLAAHTGTPSYYTIEYFVESTRGKKVYLCKYCISQKRLYVLQTQAKVVDYDDVASDVQQQLRDIVLSFRVMAQA
uniref:PsbP C-terminal domain-containing protein n=1 Tax=Calcidiscus leptoporus TaxID=127549 RepID=A0A7S0J2K1_9EUKA|mmetsp:Transcript_35353/g.82617  ORF Transcript_35353/g.82617 Transcript_35353/m.82617 type:complete len:137 (+) Transcript_35353:357-767(+)